GARLRPAAHGPRGARGALPARVRHVLLLLAAYLAARQGGGAGRERRAAAGRGGVRRAALHKRHRRAGGGAMRTALVFVGLALTLGLTAALVAHKERVVASGTPVLLEL